MNNLLEQAKHLSVNDLEKIVADSITNTGNYHRSFFTNLIVPQLYRARIHAHLEGNIEDGILNSFTHEGEFWNPPAKSIHTFGRCNDIGKSLLYCSTSWETAISEVRPAKGDYLSMAIYHIKEPGLGSRISPIGIQYLSQIPSLVNMFEKYKPSPKEEIIKMDEFLDELFHLEVSDEKKYKYKLSIAVTNCLMKDIKTDNTFLAMQGIMYSSIIRNKKSFNLLLEPIHAREIYELHQVQTFKVIESDNEKALLHLQRNGYTINSKPHPLDFFEMLWETLAESSENDKQVDLGGHCH
ncbi:hypothetical protein PQG22_04285 [Aquirufa beregesia]